MLYFLNREFTIENLKFFLRQFKCQRCKEPCCVTLTSGIALFPDEVERLAMLKGLSKSKFKELHTFTKDNKRLLSVPCSFYKDGCTIYSQRPKVCQQFPFNQVYSKNGIKWMTVANCPAGKVIGEKYGIKPESVGVKV